MIDSDELIRVANELGAELMVTARELPDQWHVWCRGWADDARKLPARSELWVVKPILSVEAVRWYVVTDCLDQLGIREIVEVAIAHQGPAVIPA